MKQDDMTPEAPNALVLDEVSVAYDDAAGRPVNAVRGFSLALERGRIACLLGASGCGKSTVLRAIAGFEPVRAGSIQLFGRPLAGPRAHLPPEKRHVGMMFQDYALFPHLDAAGNIGFGLRRHARPERDARVHEMLDLVGLADAGNRYPHELSGGQQQRIALARALAPAPDLLLLDEPFSNLDLHRRERLAAEVRDILKASGHTAILVTHNHMEALAMADDIAIMRRGRLVRSGAAEGFRNEPAGAWNALLADGDEPGHAA